LKYGDLVQFEPIETVVQVMEANDYTEAQRLVQTFVISERMAEKIRDIAIPHLQFNEQKDNKALLTVGNYGTGKSHLMSVISTLAEHAETLEMVQHAGVKKISAAIAGKFNVFRTEIGASTMPLREIICQGITGYLETIGVEYTFPPMDQVTNNS
jgi:chromosomal replication initiation ATPase DnaA